MGEFIDLVSEQRQHASATDEETADTFLESRGLRQQLVNNIVIRMIVQNRSVL